MRNINRIKELKDDKYTFSMDNKQIASVIISIVFFSGVLFFTGYFIGKEGDSKKVLNYETKTRNVAIINTVKKTDDKINKETETKAEKVVLDNDLEVKLDDSKLKSIVKNDQVKDSKLKDTDSKAKLKLPKLVKESEKLNKVDKEAKEGKGTGNLPFKTNLKTKTKGRHVLQILATPKLKEAENLKNKLIDSGYNAFIEKTLSGVVTYNRVRIGYFKNSKEAKLFRTSFEKESGIKKTFVTTIKK